MEKLNLEDRLNIIEAQLLKIQEENRILKANQIKNESHVLIVAKSLERLAKSISRLLGIP